MMEEKFRREEQPLLYDLSVSDEDTVLYPERKRSRAAAKMKGVVSIMDKWPDNISSTMYTCGMSIFLMLFLFLMIYAIIVTLSTTHISHRKGRGNYKSKSGLEEYAKDIVVCPIIKNVHSNLNLNEYLSELKELKSLYPDFEYKLIVLINDTKAVNEEFNSKALKVLMNNKEIPKTSDGKQTTKTGILVETYMLSTFMDKSPSKVNWKKLNKDLIKFAAQAVALWDIEGVTFDIDLFTQSSKNEFRKEVNMALNDFSKRNFPEKYAKYNKEMILNNIQEIIENLEMFPINDTYSDNLKSEESRIVESTINKTEEIKMPKRTITTTSIPATDDVVTNKTTNTSNDKVFSKFIQLLQNSLINPIHKFKEDMKYEFNHFNFKNRKIKNKSMDESHSVTPYTYEKRAINRTQLNDQKDDILTTSSEFIADTKLMTNKYESSGMALLDEKFTLILDWKGRLMAAKTPCHVFIEQIFSTLRKYPTLVTPDSVIDKTLKLFCNNNNSHSQCKGIKVLW